MVICHGAAMITTLPELDRVRQECRRLVTTRSLAAAGAAVVPIPGADIVADIGLLSSMLPAISQRFELDHASVEKLDPVTAQRVLVMAASLGNTLIGRVVTRKLAVTLLRRMGVRIAGASVAKYVPVLGSAIAASVGFGALRLAGNAHVEDCYRTARALISSEVQ